MPISALTGMDMAQVMESPTSLRLLELLLKEQIAVAASAGYAFDEKYYTDTLAYYRNAGHHMPSMYDDIIHHRQTEVAFLNHRVAEIGEQKDVPVPYNRAMADLILCIDEIRSARKSS
jgi:2-dehydropantoate 2-reductase